MFCFSNNERLDFKFCGSIEICYMKEVIYIYTLLALYSIWSCFIKLYITTRNGIKRQISNKSDKYA